MEITNWNDGRLRLTAGDDDDLAAAGTAAIMVAEMIEQRHATNPLSRMLRAASRTCTDAQRRSEALAGDDPEGVHTYLADLLLLKWSCESMGYLADSSDNQFSQVAVDFRYALDDAGILGDIDKARVDAVEIETQQYNYGDNHCERVVLCGECDAVYYPRFDEISTDFEWCPDCGSGDIGEWIKQPPRE